jgi:peptidoglycan DL-endopeptidase CwlO
VSTARALLLPLAVAGALEIGCAGDDLAGGAVPPATPSSLVSSSPLRSPSPGAGAAVAYANARLGAPYCWGGTGPLCYDCSGLTQSAWLFGGKTIPRTSEAQARSLPEVPLQQALPGDILWRPGHVALYVGGGYVIAAPETGSFVRYQWARGYVRALRP